MRSGRRQKNPTATAIASNPPATEAFVKQVHGGQVVILPKVGHGYSVPRNWMPQYRQGLLDLLDAAQSAARVADARH